MAELREDPVTGRTVLLAPGRSARPTTTAPVPAPGPAPAAPTDCPFCPGHEAETPPEVARAGPGAPDTPGWRIRVVPNLFPIVGAGPGADGPASGSTPEVGGAHEVAVLDPDHDRDLARLDDDAVAELFAVLRDRARVHTATGRAHVQTLVNHGRAAGASIAHPHAQVLATDLVPPAVRTHLDRAATAGTDPVAADRATAAAHDGLVLGSDAVWAWCPWAAASPYETRISAPDAGPRFATTPDAALEVLARATRDVVRGIRALLGDVAYNVVWHDGPASATGVPVSAAPRWYLTVVPRVSTVAGFELGTGLLVNVLDPAEAAARLRPTITDGG